MKKVLYLTIFTLLTLFIGFNCICAEQKTIKYRKKSYSYDDSKEALYCGYQENFLDDLGVNAPFDGCIKITKPPTKIEGSIKYAFSSDYYLDKLTGDKGITPQLVTFDGDPVIEEEGKWWKTLNFCYSNSAWHATAALFTDYYSNKTGEYNSWLINHGKCTGLDVQGVDTENTVNVCPKLMDRLRKISELVNNYEASKNSSYITKYKTKIEEMRTLCSQAVKFADYDDACVSACLDLEKDIYELNKKMDINEEGACGFSHRLIAWIMNILKWIKYIIPVVVIILGSLDFIKATASDKDDDVKKAQGNFVKRLIAAALIFLIPLLLEFILPKFGFDYNSCGSF